MCFRRILLVFSLITIIISCTEKKSEYPVIIETFDGMKVVTNPDFPRDGVVTCELEEELSIGGDVDDEDYIFHRPQDMKVAADGTIFVMDGGNSTFKIYDKEGKYIRTIGGRGQGPGEFERFVYFSVGSDGNVYIIDVINRRVAILNEHGDYISGFRIEDGLPTLIATDQNNFLYLRIQFQDEETRRLSIHRYNSAGEEIINYGLFKIVQPVITRATKTSVRAKTSRVAPTTVWTVNPEGKLYAGYGDKYQISVYDSNGKLSIIPIRQNIKLLGRYENEKANLSDFNYYPIFLLRTKTR